MNRDTDQEDDLQSIANTILNDETNSLASIHSTKSMKMLLKRSCENATSVPLNVIMEETNSESIEDSKMNPPVTIVHTQDDGARLRATKSLNKLPFKNRNPAL